MPMVKTIMKKKQFSHFEFRINLNMYHNVISVPIAFSPIFPLVGHYAGAAPPRRSLLVNNKQ
jgi:hypothetical protein